MDRAGAQPIPARLGRVFPVREFRPGIRRDQPIRPGTVRCVCRQTPQTQPPLGDEEGDLRVTGQPRADHLVWNRHCPQALSALEGNGRTPTMKNVGEPCAGKPHARFDGEGLETEPRPPRQLLTLPPDCSRGLVLSWGFVVLAGECTNYAKPKRCETPSSSKARRCSGVGVVITVKAGMSSAG